jgi:predicted transcriptional regulator
MTLFEIVRELGLKVKSGSDRLDRSVKGGYAGDLLSDVMANGEADYLWVTLQLHPNVVAVASLKELAGILLINGREPAEETVKKAEEEGIPILVSDQSAFEVVGRLYSLGISSRI